MNLYAPLFPLASKKELSPPPVAAVPKIIMNKIVLAILLYEIMFGLVLRPLKKQKKVLCRRRYPPSRPRKKNLFGAVPLKCFHLPSIIFYAGV